MVFALMLEQKQLMLFQGRMESGQRVTSGQPNLANYETEAELEAKVDSLKGKDYYKEHTMTEEEFAEYKGE